MNQLNQNLNKRIILPWPPSGNRYWRHVNGVTMISKEARIYKTIVQTLIMVSRLKKLEGRLSMQIFAYPPDKRKRDLDNLIKVLQDSLQKSGLFNDDSQIDKLYIERKEVKKSGCLEIIIEEIEA